MFQFQGAPEVLFGSRVQADPAGRQVRLDEAAHLWREYPQVEVVNHEDRRGLVGDNPEPLGQQRILLLRVELAHRV